MSSASESPPQSPLPEAGSDPGDSNRPMSEERDTPPAPAANPNLDMDDLDNADNAEADDLSDDSDLSDVDEAQFEDFDPANIAIEDRPAIAVDETNIGLIGVHKRKRAEGVDGEGAKKKKKEGRREKPKKSRKKRDDDVFSGGEELEGKREKRKKVTTERKERPKPRARSPENEDLLSPEERRRRALDRAMDAALKNPNKRRRKKDEHDLEDDADASIDRMRQRMMAAAEADNESRKAGVAAHQKLKILPEVVALLHRNTWQNALVDPEANLMETVRFFLEPLSDGSLPAYNIQRDLFDAVAKLPITHETLVASGLGKVTLFYTKSKRPEVGIKRQAERLLGEWSRPILKRTDDYRKRDMPTVEFDPDQRGRSTTFTPKPSERQRALELPVRNPNRAQVETAVSSYSIVPKSTIQQTEFKKPIGASGEDRFRKMKARMMGKVGGGVPKR
ncbi:MAG: Transcription factor iws1 [Thelocarpon impressellum]|nr:MAG: Transcription factor iws1 [Thelocarpon impressellum]